jgi:hypothetical protein
MDELTQKVQEYINQEIERQVREITIHLTSESIVNRLEELIRENERLQSLLVPFKIEYKKSPNQFEVPVYKNEWVYNPGPTCTNIPGPEISGYCSDNVDFTRDDHDLLKKYSRR